MRLRATPTISAVVLALPVSLMLNHPADAVTREDSPPCGALTEYARCAPEGGQRPPTGVLYLMKKTVQEEKVTFSCDGGRALGQRDTLASATAEAAVGKAKQSPLKDSTGRPVGVRARLTGGALPPLTVTIVCIDDHFPARV